jgi:hypothetical protein
MRTRTSRLLLAAGFITAATLGVPAMASAAPEPVPTVPPVPTVSEMQSWTPEQMLSFMESPGHDALMTAPGHVEFMQSAGHQAFMDAVGHGDCMVESAG